MNIEARPWEPQDLIDDLQSMIDEEPDSYMNTRRTTLCMAQGYLKEFFDREANDVTVQQQPRPLEDWGEDYGDVLWWKFPIEEPPYVGSPLDERWPGYHTHWTPFNVPDPPKEV